MKGKQFRMLLYKNWLLHKTSPLSTLIIIILPIACITIFFAFRNVIQFKIEQDYSFIDKNQTLKLYGNPLVPFLLQIRPTIFNNYAQDRYVGLGPKQSPLIPQFVDYLQKLKFPYKYFDSNEQLNSYILDQDYENNKQKISFAVFVQKNQLNYTCSFRFNLTQYAIIHPSRPYNLGYYDFNSYASNYISGAMGLSTIFNNLIINDIVDKQELISSLKQQITNSTFLQSLDQQLLNQQINDIEIILQNQIIPIYQQQIRNDLIYQNLYSAIFFITILPLVLIYGRFTELMLIEKQTKVKQTMLIMGMSQNIYYLSWISFYFFIYLIINLGSSCIISIIFRNTPFYVPFVINLLMHSLLIIQSVLIQLFMDRSKFGLMIALIFFIIQFLPVLFLCQNLHIIPDLYSSVSISAFAAYGLVFRIIVFSESFQIPLNFSDQIGGYKLQIALKSLGINIAIWLALTLLIFLLYKCKQKKETNHFKKCGQKMWIKNTSANELIKQPNFRNTDIIQQYQQAKISLKVTSLSKSFKQFIALNQINLKLDSNSITILLGENGAGKSTLINIITGLISPSKGQVNINWDGQKKQAIGFCPQFDTLYDELTVQDHIKIFESFSNTQKSYKIEDLIQDVGIIEKLKQKTKNLSGGQKRKLSVLLAFLADVLVILDQPTSGMDIDSRRNLWQMIKKYKQIKTILITSHHLEDDNIGDEKVIVLSKGHIVSNSSVNNMRKTYRKYEKLTILKQSQEVGVDQIFTQCKHIIPESKIFNHYTKTLQILIPSCCDVQLLIKGLQMNKIKLGIRDLCICSLTLEQIYQITLQDAHVQGLYINAQLEAPEISERKRRRGIVFFSHFLQIISKRFKIKKRHRVNLLFQLIFPIILTLFGLLIIIATADQQVEAKSLTDLELNKGENGIFLSYSNSNSTIFKPDQQFLSQIQGQINTLFNDKININISQNLNRSQFDQQILSKQLLQFPKLFGGIYFSDPKFFMGKLIISTNYFVDLGKISTIYSLQTLLTQTLISLTNQTSNLQINLINDPLPLTRQQVNRHNFIGGFLCVIILSLSMALYFSSVASYMAKERIKKIKFHQQLSGLNKISYIIGNYVYDLVFYIVLGGIILLLLKLFQVQAFISENRIGFTITFIVLFGLSYIPFIYILTYFVKTHESAQGYTFYFTFISGGILPLLLTIFRIIQKQTAFNEIAHNIAWIFRLIPAFCFGQGLSNLSSLRIYNIQSSQIQDIFKVDDMLITLLPLILLIVETGLYFCIYIITNYFSFQDIIGKFLKMMISQQDYPILPNKVVENRARILQTQPKEFMLLIRNLWKIYYKPVRNKKIILRDLCLAIKKKSVFGLLGINGSGKTTIFKILTKFIKLTSGQVYIEGTLRSNLCKETTHMVGYCPQFDPLDDQITLEEHLQIYYQFKQLKVNKIKIIDYLINYLGLQQYRKVQAGKLSGGNKRKLSFAIAIMGNPKLLLLDQPSTGMDPVSKRFMWSVIANVRASLETTILLTSHCIQQVQKLTTEIGIMKNGNFQLIEKTQDILLQNIGYEVHLKLENHQSQIALIKRYLLQKKSISQVELENIGEIIQSIDCCQQIKKKARQNQRQFVLMSVESLIAKVLQMNEMQIFKMEYNRLFQHSCIIKNQKHLIFFQVYRQQLADIYKKVKMLDLKIKIENFQVRKSFLSSIFRDVNQNDYQANTIV